jgi:hypothetical protein
MEKELLKCNDFFSAGQYRSESFSDPAPCMRCRKIMIMRLAERQP